MKDSVLESLDRLFADMPFMRAAGVGITEIDKAQEILGVTFVADYREFLIRYGGAIVGPYPIYGLARAEPMDAHLCSVIDVTRHFRKQARPDTERWYVISMVHAGNPVGLDERGKVISFDHEAGEMIAVAESFERYLQRCLTHI